MINKISTVLASAILTLTVCSTFCFASGINMQEGEWETTLETKMEGVPFAMPPTKIKQCITPENIVPGVSPEDNGCKIKNQKIAGDKVVWSLECANKDGKSEMEGEATYSGNSYKGTMKTRMTEKSGETMIMTATMTGRRIGDCTDKSKSTVSVGGKEIEMDSAKMEKMKADAEKQMAEAKRMQAEYEKKQKEEKVRWEALDKIAVPKEDSGSCKLATQSFWDPDCDNKVGKLNLKPGLWEITTQEGETSQYNKSLGTYRVNDPNQRTQCLTFASPMISSLNIPAAREAKVSSGKITWQYSSTYNTQMGGVVYKGEALEGAVLENIGAMQKKKTSISAAASEMERAW